VRPSVVQRQALFNKSQTAVPADEAGPLFKEPWEAPAFALVITLHRAECFTSAEWVDAISAEIRQAQADGDPDLSNIYYHHWLTVLEKIILAKDLADDIDLRPRRIECGFNVPGKQSHPARQQPICIASLIKTASRTIGKK